MVDKVFKAYLIEKNKVDSCLIDNLNFISSFLYYFIRLKIQVFSYLIVLLISFIIIIYPFTIFIWYFFNSFIFYAYL